jgi:hypothetical protein
MPATATVAYKFLGGRMAAVPTATAAALAAANAADDLECR